MRYSILGRSGLRVSKLCLGTMTFGPGAAWSRPVEECRAVFDAFAAAGGNFIDTANMYTGGESERMVGEFIASDRDRFIICTKYANAVPGAGDPNAAGSHRKSMVRSVEASLERLGVDYIDVYMTHFWDFSTPIEEVQRAPVGIVLHTTESLILPFEAERNVALLRSGEDVLAHARGGKLFFANTLDFPPPEKTRLGITQAIYLRKRRNQCGPHRLL